MLCRQKGAIPQECGDIEDFCMVRSDCFCEALVARLKLSEAPPVVSPPKPPEPKARLSMAEAFQVVQAHKFSGSRLKRLEKFRLHSNVRKV